MFQLVIYCHRVSLFLLLLCPALAKADDLIDCRKLWLSGQYEACAQSAGKMLTPGRPGTERFAELKARSEAAIGNYEAATRTLLDSIRANPLEIQNRWLLIELAPYANQAAVRQQQLRDIEIVVGNGAWRYTQDSGNLVTLANFALAQGADAKQVQSALLERARKLFPTHLEPILAMGQLALDKRDFALAAETFRDGLKLAPQNPELTFGLAQALEDSQQRESKALLARTLKRNPQHAAAILMESETLINAEQFEQALQRLNDILAFNPHHPEALALKSVIHQLQGQTEVAEEFRSNALSTWNSNPHVDFLIGKKLSQKYRFQEGAAAQQRALAFDPQYLPARKQLTQDLLRLGREAEGWQLADLTYQQDQYDVATYNLVTLRDELENFTTIQREGMHLRMESEEAAIYGQRVADLLQSARQTLSEKYELELPETILIEIFPKPADFAVRTFGLPGAGGYLGVCFGDVITAKSPASQTTHPVNWESVLWHEFAHVVTLNKTHNRMPRWLSEGISVYEERQHDPTWGEHMTPAYRQMIEEGQLTPISQLSGAFLAPRSGQHLMFAYFESSLVVQYIIEKYGHPTLLAILDDLTVGMPINEAISRHTVPLPQLEEEFDQSARLQAKLYGWFVDWSTPNFSRILQRDDAADRLVAWAAAHPRNYPGLKTCGELLLQMGRTSDAAKVLEKATLLFPDETGTGSALARLAELQQQLNQLKAERESLESLIRIDDDAATALIRLLEIVSIEENWKQVDEISSRLVAINPLIPQPYVGLAIAAEQRQDHATAIQALETLLQFPNVDIADVHYRLAVQLVRSQESTAAKRHVLQALEQAPRYRAALELLLELHAENSPE